MEMILFGITAAIAVIGAIAMVVSRNAVHSALFLLLNFAAIAVLYLLLHSPFLFAIQLTVYAGAIMVLFLFVVMLLGAERAEEGTDRLAWQRPFALALGVALLGLALFAAYGVPSSTPDPVAVEALADPAQIGAILFTEYLFPFQLTGIILLVAVVGVVVLNQRRKEAARTKDQASRTM